MSNLSIDNKVEKGMIFDEDPYKTKKFLRPLDIQRHKRDMELEKAGVFFSFLWCIYLLNFIYKM